MERDDMFLTPNIGKPDRRVGYFRDDESFRHFARAYRDGMAELPPAEETITVRTSFGWARAYRFGHGTGEPLVLISGRQASTPMWRANLASLLGNRAVWSIDTIGEPGASVQTAPITQPREHAHWLDDTLGQLGLHRVHLMGVSIGGWLATWQAIHRPDRLASIILLDPMSTFAPFTWKMVAVSIGSVVPAMPASLRHRLLSWISGGARSSDELPEGRLIAAGMRDYVGAHALPRRPSTEELAAISIPVLAILAGRSIVHDPRRAATRAAVIPTAQVEVWPNASHAINGEFPEEIAERVIDFIAGPNGPSVTPAE
ncbi:alpha/beta fold hydrolase [Nocardia nova]|uniref:alpha/beta fold hydrolase n=1 Tax=Nocardia nova TaxID=37330 RepID=UPI003409F478